jgi:transposase-like protein
MPKSYSQDLRERVIEAVEMGASRHEAADRFDVSVSSAVKWLQRWRESEAAARSVETLDGAIADAFRAFTPQECANYFVAAGYGST